MARARRGVSGSEPAATGPSARQLGGPGFRLVEQAARTVARHDMLSDSDSVVVALSGGPDSTCLLDALRRLQPTLALTLTVAHVDHGLSESSRAVASEVARLAAQAGLDVHVVRAPDLAGANLHARARAFRYGFFATVAARVGAISVATGHTLDDRVETTLARLVHGAGTEGLAGLPPVEEGRIRPLVAARRSETRAYCKELGLDFVDDPGNEDPRFERSAVRAKVVTVIQERWGDGAVRAIAQSAQLLRDDAEALSFLAERFYADIALRGQDGVAFESKELRDLPRALRRRLLQLAVGRVRDRSGGIDAALDAFDAGAKPDARFSVASGIEIVVGKERVLVLGAGSPRTESDD